MKFDFKTYISLNIAFIILKLYEPVDNICLEGTVSQK